MWFSIFLLLILLHFSVFVIDAVPQLNTWQSRIKIGRFQNREDWQQKIMETSVSWLKSTPTIKLTDNSRLIILDILKGNYKRTAIQSWQQAALFLGLTDYFRKTNDKTVHSALLDFINENINANGSWKVKPTESDQAILAYALLNAQFINHEKYRPAFDETWQMIQTLKGKDGTVAYKKHVSDFRFVDTVGFISPFLINYGLKFNNPEAVDLGITQIKDYQKFGMMSGENIPCHTYHVQTKIPIGLFGWGRGLGWFVIGLADSWKSLPDIHPDKEELQKIMVQTVKSAAKFQDDNGGFHWLLFDPASRLDSSTAATLAYLFSVAQEIPEIADICHSAKEKSLGYLQSVTRRNGAIDFSQGDTKGIGVYSQNFDVLPFTQGFTLRSLFYPNY